MIRRILVGLGVVVAQVARMLGIRREVTSQNLERAFPDLSANDIRKILGASYSNLGRVFAEMLYLRFASRKAIARQMHFKNPSLFHDFLQQGKGLVVVAGHLANWEWMAIAGPLHLGKPFAVVVKNNPVHRTEKFLQAMRRKTGNELINSADVRGMFRTLGRSGCVALLSDQAAPTESTKVTFFNSTIPAFEGPARLALRTKSPVVFAKCVRENNGSYELEFLEVPTSDLQNDSPENVQILTQRHTWILEQAIREHPAQWVWQHRRWKNA